MQYKFNNTVSFKETLISEYYIKRFTVEYVFIMLTRYPSEQTKLHYLNVTYFVLIYPSNYFTRWRRYCPGFV